MALVVKSGQVNYNWHVRHEAGSEVRTTPLPLPLTNDPPLPFLRSATYYTMLKADPPTAVLV